THDHDIAAQTDRMIEIKDGKIISDTRTAEIPHGTNVRSAGQRRFNPLQWVDRGVEATRMALRAMASHKLRTFLTMLGIIIGIAAIGTNTINVYPGTGFGDRGQGRIRTLVASDADALAKEPYADSVTPRVSTNQSVLFNNVAVNAQVSGVGVDYFRVSGSTLSDGASFDSRAVDQRAQVAVIDTNAQTAIFTHGENPIGQVIVVGNVPIRVIGVV